MHGRLWLGRAEPGACGGIKEKEGRNEIASQSPGAHKMSDVAVGISALYSGLPTTQMTVHGWQLEISLQALEEQAGPCKLTLAQHPEQTASSPWEAHRIDCPADHAHSTAHPLQAKDRRGTVPTEESVPRSDQSVWG